MLNAKTILKHVFGDDPAPDLLPTGRLSRFAAPKTADLQEADTRADAPVPKPIDATNSDPRLSRFVTRHHRAKPKASVPLAVENAHLVAQQISNDGVDMIPLSVLQNALPDRVTSRGTLESVGAMMEVGEAWEPRRTS